MAMNKTDFYPLSSLFAYLRQKCNKSKNFIDENPRRIRIIPIRIHLMVYRLLVKDFVKQYVHTEH